MSYSSMCLQTVTFERKSVSPDALNLGHNETFTAIYSNVVASVQPASAAVRDVFSRSGLEVTHTVYLPGVYTLMAGDRMVQGSTYYIVTGPVADVAGRGRTTRVLVKQMDQ